MIELPNAVFTKDKKPNGHLKNPKINTRPTQRNKFGQVINKSLHFILLF